MIKLQLNNRLTDLINFLKSNILGIFAIFILLMIVLGGIYYTGINPNDTEVNIIVNKFSINEYSFPYHVAERYLVWRNMRDYFFALNYVLTLLGIVASLMTVFYASKNAKDDEENKKHNNYIIFLSLLSTCFTIANIFIKADTMANISQHAWRELDVCIMETIYDPDLSSNSKDSILINKVSEIENYLETYEH